MYEQKYCRYKKRLHAAFFYEQDVATDATDQFTKWWHDALNSEISEVNATTLATASAKGIPSARIVLLKGYDDKGFVFLPITIAIKEVILMKP